MRDAESLPRRQPGPRQAHRNPGLPERRIQTSRSQEAEGRLLPERSPAKRPGLLLSQYNNQTNRSNNCPRSSSNSVRIPFVTNSVSAKATRHVGSRFCRGRPFFGRASVGSAKEQNKTRLEWVICLAADWDVVYEFLKPSTR